MQTLLEFESSIDLEKLEDSDHLLDTLLGVENVLDSLDVYCYRNWFDGEVVEGPIVRRHWVSVSLLYPIDKMPDPRAALRLLKHGVQVEFNRVKRAKSPTPAELQPTEPEEPTNWLVKLTVPQRLLDQTEEAKLEIYDDEVDTDDVSDAQDTGLDNESQYKSDEQLPDQPPPDQTMPGQMPPGQMPAQPMPGQF